MISVILPIYNEYNNPFLSLIIQQFYQDPFFELIIVDGGSTDGTLDNLQRYAIEIYSLPHSTRAARLNKGIQLAQHPYVLLHHPRSIISEPGINFLKANHTNYQWAAFQHRFDANKTIFRFISWYSNQVRVCKKNIVYLDHCMLINRQLLQTPAMPDIEIFEDTALSNSLKNKVNAKLLPYNVTTSAIRFINRGPLRHFCLNQILKLFYHLNIKPSFMNKLYEKKLNLNQTN
jgi:glycosyltransferase involved in cell wall biosynthesis